MGHCPELRPSLPRSLRSSRHSLLSLLAPPSSCPHPLLSAPEPSVPQTAGSQALSAILSFRARPTGAPASLGMGPARGSPPFLWSGWELDWGWRGNRDHPSSKLHPHPQHPRGERFTFHHMLLEKASASDPDSHACRGPSYCNPTAFRTAEMGPHLGREIGGESRGIWEQAVIWGNMAPLLP